MKHFRRLVLLTLGFLSLSNALSGHAYAAAFTPTMVTDGMPGGGDNDPEPDQD
ncbi:hypothetical protein HNQ07_004243 [Deinococcus metalli]|uniref:Uncharacterized protein n=1 Tax=Deinococcus metalli TaxID=1141878 RepID=A0A7W8KKM6_9DEIO|nr:hypothetical protein [Deinococcus metalli]MBB5378736.1 hypothetical protein [Deinococcus metalli]